MLRKEILLTGAACLMALTTVLAQTGKLSGKVTDKDNRGEPVPFANVVVNKDGVFKYGTTTDFDGNFEVPALTPGSYDVKVSYVGYAEKTIQGVVINFEKTTRLNVELTSESNITEEVLIYATPLIDPDNTSTGKNFTAKDIEKLPTRSINAVINTASGVYTSDDGGAIYIKGARESANQTFINGVKVLGNPNVPIEAISEISVINGGIPAQFGDVVGGVINITTKGASSKFYGGTAFETSSLFDQWHYNFASVNLSGPILKKRVLADDGESSRERTVLGFFSAIQYTYNRDPDPPATGVWTVKPEAKERYEQNNYPYYGDVPPGVYEFTAANTTFDDVYKSKYRLNNRSHQLVLNTSIDYQPNDDMIVTVGGLWQYSDRSAYSYGRSMFNYDNNPQVIGSNLNIFARFVHNFKKSKEDDTGPLKNAYYQVQVDYARTDAITQRRDLKDELFSYMHVGEFKQRRSYARNPVGTPPNQAPAPIWNTFQSDSFTVFASPNPGGGYTYYNQNSHPDLYWFVPRDTFSFTPSSANPVLAQYTQNYFDYVRSQGGAVTDLSGFGGFGIYRNGNGPGGSAIHGIYSNVGAPFATYNRSSTEQYRISALFVAQLKKHALKAGFEYEQRVSSYYSLATGQLWLAANGAIGSAFGDRTNNDLLFANGTVENDTFYAGGYLSPVGTINGDLGFLSRDGIYNGNKFSDELFARAGTYNLDEVDPRMLSIDMFTADDLNGLNQRGISYAGYSYTGKRKRGTVSLDDFFGDPNNRAVDSYRPSYIAVFAEDKFEIKDLIIRVGVRVDRFDANQQVLKDKFSLTELTTLGSLRDKMGNFKNGNLYADGVPATFSDKTAIYVTPDVTPDNYNGGNEDQFEIFGFRDGDIWYDAEGRIANANSFLINNAVPLYNIGAATKDSDPGQLLIWNESGLTQGAFEDYKPQYNVMPRISFSFPISEDALFYAHYDVLTQRPIQGSNFVTAQDYYFLRRDLGNAIANPNLFPQLTIDYQLGFQQRLTNSSSLKIAAYYRDFRDQIQAVPVVGAYMGGTALQTYTTFANIDYGTSKGLTFDYELRRTKNLSMYASYTLQFAEGTGSSENSQGTINRTLAQVGQQNTRIIIPLSFDQRHAFKVNFDYRFKQKEGFKIREYYPLENVGVNFTVDAGSGTPYTRLGGIPGRMPNPNDGRIDGQLNSSRLPWQSRVGFRVDKSWNFRNERTGRQQSLNVYVYIQNLLNARNVVSLYRFTGDPTDDGYLSSAQGQNEISLAASRNQRALIDMYTMALQNPDNFALPRRVRLGIAFNF